jgi:stage III sporulation protein AH
MFNVKRNQIIVTVLVFMIAVAAYLNFTDSGMPLESVEVNSGAELTIEEIQQDPSILEQYATLEGEEITTLAPDSLEDATEQMVVIAKKDTNLVADNGMIIAEVSDDTSYFVEEKMLREQSRAAQVEKLTEYVANENLDKESKAKAAENLLAIQEKIEKESAAESLLRAKGFKDVFVRIDTNNVDVVVNKEKLTDAEIAQIEEIVYRKTGYSVGQIKITPLSLKTEIE